MECSSILQLANLLEKLKPYLTPTRLNARETPSRYHNLLSLHDQAPVRSVSIDGELN